MPLDLADLVSNKATVVVPYGGGEVKVVYKPALITQKSLSEMDEGDDGHSVFLSAVITSWDVLDGRKKVPITKDALDKLPLPFLRTVVLGILRDRSDATGEAVGSSNGSS